MESFKSRKRNGRAKQNCARNPPSSHKPLCKDTLRSKEAKSGAVEVTQYTQNGDDIRLFPGSTALTVTLLTVVLRVHYVTQERNWWILHPDEIYQSLEVAFSELNGYGYRTYEFLPPSSKADNLSPYQQRAQQLGMYALRSPLYPRFYTAVGWVAQWLGCSWTPYLTWRTAHVIVSSMLPLAAHVFATTVFRSRDAGALAAILTASSVHLGVLGTHTLVHSLLAPVIFISLAALAPLLEDPERDEDGGESQQAGTSPDANAESCNRHASVPTATEPRPHPFDRHSLQRCETPRRVKHGTRRSQRVAGTFSSPGSVFSVLFKFVSFVEKQIIVLLGAFCPLDKMAPETIDDRSALEERCESEKSIVSLARDATNNGDITGTSVNKHFPSDLISTHSPVTNGGVVSSETAQGFTAATGKLPKSTNKRKCNKLKVLICGFALALCCYIRPDTVLLLFAFLLPYSPQIIRSVMYRQNCPLSFLLSLIIGGCLGILLGTLDDAYFYGVGVVSPYNWFQFNFMSNMTSRLFGAEPSAMYVHDFLLKNNGMCVLLFVNMVGFTITMLKMRCQSFVQDGISLASKLRLLLTIVVLFGAYSFQSHKELRFIHHIMVLYFVFTASNIASIIAFVKKSFGSISSKCLLSATLLIFIYSQWKDWPNPRNDAFKTWVYNPTLDNYDVNECVRFIASQNDVRGVFSQRNINSIGGYTFLRHNVPLLTFTFAGYVEYGMSSRTVTLSSNWLGERSNVSFTTSDIVSNFYSSQNTQYLVRHLLTHREYNYLLMDKSTKFLDVGFKDVKFCGDVKVIKRTGSDVGEKHIREIIPSLKVAPEVDVLEREARELRAFGLNDLAAERFNEAQRLKRFQKS